VSIPVKLWLSDFDSTAFDTFRPPQTGLGVDEFYFASIGRIFGEAALAAYLERGGLRNRSPGEVVQELMPGADFTEVGRWTDRLIAVKLSLQLEQIGRQKDGSLWPEPCAGFTEFWRALDRYVQAGRVATGIISSGHTAFIEKAWDLHGLSRPGLIVSDDDCRRLARPSNAKQWVKPGTQPILYARRRLAAINRMGVPPWPEVRYFGDSLAKDGRMAEKVGAWFGHFDPQCRPRASRFGAQFPDWRWVAARLPEWLGPI
jgi:hypothetical protein